MPGATFRLRYAFCCALAVSAAAPALAAPQTARDFVWAADPEGGAPFVEADPAHPERVVGFDVEVAELIARGLGRAPRFLNITFYSIDQSVARGDATEISDVDFLVRLLRCVILSADARSCCLRDRIFSNGYAILSTFLYLGLHARTLTVAMAQATAGVGAWEWPDIAAVYMYMVVPPILLFIVVQRWFMRGLTEGALKM